MEFHKIELNLEFHKKIRQNLMFLKWKKWNIEHKTQFYRKKILNGIL